MQKSRTSAPETGRTYTAEEIKEFQIISAMPMAIQILHSEIASSSQGKVVTFQGTRDKIQQMFPSGHEQEMVDYAAAKLTLMALTQGKTILQAGCDYTHCNVREVRPFADYITGKLTEQQNQIRAGVEERLGEKLPPLRKIPQHK
jgi:hypothetical protein